MELVLCGGELYITSVLEDERGWLIWAALRPDSEVYHVGTHGCTCPVDGECKHMRALLSSPASKPKQLEPKDRRRSRG